MRRRVARISLRGPAPATETKSDITSVEAEVPLKDMFGYAGDLRSVTQGKGDFSMEYKSHEPVPKHMQEELIEELRKRKAEQ